MNHLSEPRHPTASLGFTEKRGQSLAFIHAYTLVMDRPPAEVDLQRHFRVTPPSVHGMVLALERAGLIRREPGRARTIAVLVDAKDLPPLRPRQEQPVRTSVQRYSHVRRFKLQTQKFLRPLTRFSAWPPRCRAGGTIMKRRLIML